MAHAVNVQRFCPTARDAVLGSGEFGVVHPGIFNSEPVAIKTFKRTLDIDEFKAVLAELKMMAYLGGHDFIVKFVGAEISEIAQREAQESQDNAVRQHTFSFKRVNRYFQVSC